MKVEIRDSKLHLSGYVNAVERDSKVITTKRGKCVEQIAAGAFAASMADGHEVRMKLNHKRDIGSTTDGVLTLKEDNIGLYAEAETDDEELMTLAGKGELRGWSFGFVAKDDELESRDGKEPRRRVKALDLQEVSILSVTPAYNGTSVEVRSYEQYSDTVEAYRDNEGNITNVTVSHRESDANGSKETTTFTDERGTATETVTRTHSYEKDAQALKNTIAQLKMKGYILEKRAEQRELEERYNHYHDPRNGRFASGKGGGNGLYYSMGKGKGEIVGNSSPWVAPTFKPQVKDEVSEKILNAYNINVSRGTITLKDEESKTRGLIRGITRFNDMPFRDQIEINTKIKQAGGLGEGVKNSDIFVKDKQAYVLNNIYSQRTLNKLGEHPGKNKVLKQLEKSGFIIANYDRRGENEQRELEKRYNPYHDPKNGRFTNSGYGGGIGALYVPKGYKGQGVIVGASTHLTATKIAREEASKVEQEYYNGEEGKAYRERFRAAIPQHTREENERASRNRSDYVEEYSKRVAHLEILSRLSPDRRNEGYYREVGKTLGVLRAQDKILREEFKKVYG